jgi:hypothetical protein
VIALAASSLLSVSEFLQALIQSVDMIRKRIPLSMLIVFFANYGLLFTNACCFRIKPGLFA